MLVFLLDSASEECVQRVFENLWNTLGSEIFEVLFSVMLIHNGGEFKAPEALEFTSYGYRRIRIFYCDPMLSWQKPHIERSHKFIRQVIQRTHQRTTSLGKILL